MGKLVEVFIIMVLLANTVTGRVPLGSPEPIVPDAPSAEEEYLMEKAKEKTEATAEVAPETESTERIFEIIVPCCDTPYWKRFVEGVLDRANYLSVSVNCVGPVSESEMDFQINQLQYAIDNNFDGIAFIPCDAQIIPETYQMASDSGIPFVYVQRSDYNFSRKSGVTLLEICESSAEELAAEKLFWRLEDTISGAKGPARIGVINYMSDEETRMGVPFTKEFAMYAAAYGYSIAIIGDKDFVDECDVDTVNESEADIIIEFACAENASMESCAEAAATIMQKPDTMGVFASSQLATEGILIAEEELGVLSDIPGDGILAIGMEFSEMIVEGIKNYKLYGAVTTSPYDVGQEVVEELIRLAEGEAEESIDVCFYKWYAAYNIDENEIVCNIGAW